MQIACAGKFVARFLPDRKNLPLYKVRDLPRKNMGVLLLKKRKIMNFSLIQQEHSAWYLSGAAN
jgi:hypothetical protein